MTELAVNQASYTSAGSPMFSPGYLDPENPAGDLMVVFSRGFGEPRTGSSYDIPRSDESTTSGSVGQVEYTHAVTTASAVLEIRRRSGLTWEELSELFEVSRRSVHHWANGKTVSAKHDREIRDTLAAIRHIDEGSQATTRDRLLTVDASGESVFDLLKAHRFDKVMTQVRGLAVPEHRRIPLSPKERDMRRPQPPMLLLEAEQERPDFPVSKARIARAVRTTKKST